MTALPAPLDVTIRGERYEGATLTLGVGGEVYHGLKSVTYTDEPHVVGVDVGRGHDKTVFSVHGYKSGVTFVADEHVGLGASEGPWCDLLAEYEGLDRWALRDALRGVRGVCQLPARRRYRAARVMVRLRSGAANELEVEWSRLEILRAERRRARNERKRQDGKARGRRRPARNGRHHGRGAT